MPIAMAIAFPDLISRIGRAGLTQPFVTLRFQPDQHIPSFQLPLHYCYHIEKSPYAPSSTIAPSLH
jgi:hypothetical protein